LVETLQEKMREMIEKRRRAMIRTTMKMKRGRGPLGGGHRRVGGSSPEWTRPPQMKDRRPSPSARPLTGWD